MGRAKKNRTADEQRLAHNLASRLWYATHGHVQYNLNCSDSTERSDTTPASSVSSSDDIHAIDNAMTPPDQAPLLERLFQPPRGQLHPRLILTYTVVFLAYLSSTITGETLGLLFVVTNVILAQFNSRHLKQNRFNKMCEHYRKEMFGATVKHYYCRRCKQIVATENVDDDEFICECGFPFVKQHNYFSAISLRQSFTTFLESTADKPRYFINTDFAASSATFYRCSGIAMRRLNIQFDETHRDLAVDLFIDNAMVSKSGAKSSMTVVQLSVANVIQHVCRSRIILAAVWYAKTPEDACPYSTILSVVVDQLRALHEQPIRWTYRERTVESRVLLRAVITDMKAKASTLGMKQVNGYYSCPYCIHKGTTEENYRRIRIPAQHGTRKQIRYDRVEANLRSSSTSTSQVSKFAIVSHIEFVGCH